MSFFTPMLLLVILVARGEADSLFVQCTNNEDFLFGVDRICSPGRPLCLDHSDQKHCSEDGGFTGCLADYRIVPCQECNCHIEMNCTSFPDEPFISKVCPAASSQLGKWEYCNDLFETSEEFNSIVNTQTSFAREKVAMTVDGEWKCRDWEGQIFPCLDTGAEYFLYAYRHWECQAQFWLLRELLRPQCIRKPYAYENKCPDPLKSCGQRCSQPKEPCNGKCRDGWVTCNGNEAVCYPDTKHCCGNPDLFFCDSEKKCMDKSKKKICHNGSCKNWSETCDLCPEGQSFCEATNQCDDWQACKHWGDFPLKVVTFL